MPGEMGGLDKAEQIVYLFVDPQARRNRVRG
jgi:hypothetical protein